MVTLWVIWGSAEPGEIVCTPLTGMLNAMVSAPRRLFAAWIAALRVHWSPWVPESKSHLPSEEPVKLPLGKSVSFSSPVKLTMKGGRVAARADLADCKPNNNKSANIIASPERRARALRVRLASEKKILICALSLLVMGRSGQTVRLMQRVHLTPEGRASHHPNE